MRCLLLLLPSKVKKKVAAAATLRGADAGVGPGVQIDHTYTYLAEEVRRQPRLKEVRRGLAFGRGRRRGRDLVLGGRCNGRRGRGDKQSRGCGLAFVGGIVVPDAVGAAHDGRQRRDLGSHHALARHSLPGDPVPG